MSDPISRRAFLQSTGLMLASIPMASQAQEPELIIDIHQHTNYSGRTNRQLIAHQHALGVTTTVLLPAGSKYGLDAGCGGNQTVLDLAKEHPDSFVFFANEVTDLPAAAAEVQSYLKKGAIGIGEQKFKVASDSPALERLAALAAEHQVPMLLHFQHATYNTGLENFHKTLEKFPKVNFIGHAQTWWGYVDKNHDPTVLYPTGLVTPGGITDRLLKDYPNIYADMSAGSGLNFLTRDEEHARGFLDRHQDKVLFGTDCNDSFGRGPGCQGAQTLARIRRLAPNPAAQRKILYSNAKRVLGL